MVRIYLDFLIGLEGKIDDAHREIQKDISQHVEYFKDRTYEKELKKSASRSQLIKKFLLQRRRVEPSIKGLGAVIHAYSPATGINYSSNGFFTFFICSKLTFV